MIDFDETLLEAVTTSKVIIGMDWLLSYDDYSTQITVTVVKSKLK
jgi:hypothetical protein